MAVRKIRQILGALFFGALIGAGLMGIAIIRSPHSHAEPMDPVVAKFLKDGGSDLVCQVFGKYGVTIDMIGKLGIAMMDTYDMTSRQAAEAERDSVLLTCPEMYDQLVTVASSAQKGSTV